MKRSRVLLSFLGGGRFLDPQTGKPKEYNSTSYRFSDGVKVQDSRFFGLEVVEWKARVGDGFDRVVLAGTTTSMWDLFADHRRSAGAVDDGLLLDLMERCEPRKDGSASPGAEPRHLEALSMALSGWKGVPRWTCVDLPFGSDHGQQVELLGRLAGTIPEEAELWIDITHGFRIFPIFALALGQILSATRGVKVEGFLYGAYDMRDADNIAPVIDLAGLLRLQKWTDALAAFDDSGTLSPFVPLLKEDGVRLGGQVEKLREITVAERANSLHRVRDTRKHVSEGLAKDQIPEGSISALFTSRLTKAVKPYPQRLSQAQRERARHFLDHDDMLQATILCHEGLVSAAVEKKGIDAWTAGYECREKVEINVPSDLKQKVDVLSKLRNSLAHGTSPESSSESNKYWREVKIEVESMRKQHDRLGDFIRGVLGEDRLWQ